MKSLKFKANCKLDITIEDSSLPQKKIKFKKTSPIGDMFVIDGDKEFIKKSLCKRVDNLVSQLEDWYENC